MNKIRIAWGITGAGDYLAESLAIMKKISSDFDVEVTALVSKNAEIVLKMYKFWDELRSSFEKIRIEKGPNQPFVAARLQIGYYPVFFISPATANTVAKTRKSRPNLDAPYPFIFLPLPEVPRALFVNWECV